MGESAGGDWGDKVAPESKSNKSAVSRRWNVVESLSKTVQSDNLEESRVCGGSRGEWAFGWFQRRGAKKCEVWINRNVRYERRKTFLNCQKTDCGWRILKNSDGDKRMCVLRARANGSHLTRVTPLWHKSRPDRTENEWRDIDLPDKTDYTIVWSDKCKKERKEAAKEIEIKGRAEVGWLWRREEWLWLRGGHKQFFCREGREEQRAQPGTTRLPAIFLPLNDAFTLVHTKYSVSIPLLWAIISVLFFFAGDFVSAIARIRMTKRMTLEIVK